MPTVRIAEPSDIEACARLLGILFSQEHEFTPDPKKQEAGLGMIIGDPAVGTVFVCEAEEGIIGMVSLLNMVSTAIGKKVAMLEDMIVDPGWRAQGIGAMLLDHASRWARAEGYGRITLLTDGDNLPAQRFYEAHGFLRSTMVAFRKRL
jgi:GNAT superfamily N-acetyltransferase